MARISVRPVVLAALVAGPLFAQQPSTPANPGFFNERAVREAIQKAFRQRMAAVAKAGGNPYAKALAGLALPSMPQPRVCVVPLLEVPVGNVDPGILLKGIGGVGDDKMILPTLPACPARHP